MGREIKFRAWDKDLKQMFFEFKITSSKGEVVTPSIFICCDDSIELMQYTGLRDKNGKEIYEGDVIILDNSDIGGEKIIGEIIWCDDQTLGCLGFGLWTKKGYLHTNLLGHIEVIGNIYENRELLGKTDE